MNTYTLSEITIYPVKSLAGISVKTWPVDSKGLKYDRKWMLVDAEGVFLSQRTLPSMALIKTAISHDTLTLSASGMADFHLPLAPQAGDLIAVKIWDDLCNARRVSAQADAWLSQFLNTDCKLVYQPDHEIRPVDPDYARPTDQASFSDGFPFLVISENSLASLNQATGKAFSMSRFRPNLVVAGCPAYDEDVWRGISINSIHFRLPKPCSRCSIPGIDPETAETSKEPLTTLSRLRRWQNKVYFGQNALHDQTGVLSVGDSVTILATGDKQPPL